MYGKFVAVYVNNVRSYRSVLNVRDGEKMA
jgi:hypothetical protein